MTNIDNFGKTDKDKEKRRQKLLTLGRIKEHQYKIYRYWKVIRKNNEQVYTKKFNNLDEMENFLEKNPHNLHKIA